MKLLVVGGEEGIRRWLVDGLRQNGHDLTEVATAEQAKDAWLSAKYDGFLIEASPPALSGHELCRWLRNQGAKKTVVMLTSEDSSSARMECLKAGADDCLSMPFDLSELDARLRAFERMLLGYPRAAIQVADLVVDPGRRTAQRGGQDLKLSRKEFDLLDYLVRNQDCLVTRPMLAQAVWEAGSGMYTNVIDVFFNFLRKKIDVGFTPKLIHNVRGKGFILSKTSPSRKLPA